MERRKRIILLIFLLFLFFLIAPLFIFYSQGYRYYSQKKELIQTGILKIKVISPPQAEVYLEEKFVGKTNPFFLSLNISFLDPKEYQVKIAKENYFPWKKKLKIKKGKITRAENIILFPKKLKFSLFEKETFDFLLKGNWLILKKEKGLKFINLAKKEEVLFPFLEKKFFWDDFLNEKFLFSGKKTYLYDLKRKRKIYLGSFEKAKFFPKNPDKIFLLKEKRLYLFNLLKKEKKLLLKNVLDFLPLEKKIIFIDKDGLLKTYDLEKKKIKISLNESLKSFKIRKIGKKIFFEKEGDFFQIKEGRLKKVFKGAKEFVSLNKKILFCKNHEIWIYENEKEIFIDRFFEKISSCNWLNQFYLYFLYKDKLAIIETDLRDGLNFYLFDFPFPLKKVVLKEKRFYLLGEKNLYLSFPLYED